jgi:hypothetical protein
MSSSYDVLPFRVVFRSVIFDLSLVFFLRAISPGEGKSGGQVKYRRLVLHPPSASHVKRMAKKVAGASGGKGMIRPL